MVGDHAICKENYKYYDVHYLCVCRSGSCAERGNRSADPAGEAVQTEKIAESGERTVQETANEESAVTSGKDEGTTENRTATTEKPKPTAGRGRPRKKTD